MIHDLPSSLYIMMSYAFAGGVLLILALSLYWRARRIEHALAAESSRQEPLKELND